MKFKPSHDNGMLMRTYTRISDSNCCGNLQMHQYGRLCCKSILRITISIFFDPTNGLIILPMILLQDSLPTQYRWTSGTKNHSKPKPSSAVSERGTFVQLVVGEPGTGWQSGAIVRIPDGKESAQVDHNLQRTVDAYVRVPSVDSGRTAQPEKWIRHQQCAGIALELYWSRNLVLNCFVIFQTHQEFAPLSYIRRDGSNYYITDSSSTDTLSSIVSIFKVFIKPNR